MPQVAGGVVAVAARSGVVVVAVQDGGDVGVEVVVVPLFLDPAVGVVDGLLPLGLAASGTGGPKVGVADDAPQFVVRPDAGQTLGDAGGAVARFQDAVAGVVLGRPDALVLRKTAVAQQDALGQGHPVFPVKLVVVGYRKLKLNKSVPFFPVLSPFFPVRGPAPRPPDPSASEPARTVRRGTRAAGNHGQGPGHRPRRRTARRQVTDQAAAGARPLDCRQV